jgi:peptidyl-dipeptidase A
MSTPLPSGPEPGLDRRAFLGRAAALAALSTTTTVRAGVAAADDGPQAEADAFLARFVEGWLPLNTASAEAAWDASTDVSEEHTAAQVKATLAVNRFVGAPEVIATVKRLLEAKDRLGDLTVRQLEEVRLMAAEAPGTIPEVVEARAQAEAKQSAAQDGFAYAMPDPADPSRPITANGIDRVLVESRELPERLAVWEESKTIGAPLREGLLRLRDLRNKVARELGFDDFFALQVADYSLTVPQMIDLCDGFLAEVRPLYDQLHTWAKHTLAARYGVEPPEGAMPAHWLTNRWGQNWPGLVEGVDMDAPFKGKPKEFITEQAERFYVSLGFPGLPKSFYAKSDLYPADPASGRKKNSHASAWHIDLRDDVRSLMSIEPDSRWFTTAHHELGHIYYYIAYSTPRVPYLLRGGANRAFHEGVGDLIGLAAGQRPYLKAVGLLTKEAEAADPVKFLLDTALDGSSVVFLPWSAGVMTRFERDFYAGKVSDDALNAAWWALVGTYQGIAPPGVRPETLCDAATKTHINDDPAQYYDYAIGTVLKFQLHDHICREILKQDPRDCNYFGDKRVGKFLRDILSLGATRDWDAVLREATGSGLSAKALVAYFEPLRAWLQEQNAGRKVGWS